MPRYREHLTPNSSNVHSFRFSTDADGAGTLFVTFQGPKRNPTYAYSDVPNEVYHRFRNDAKSRSAGKAVWDYLRIRGTQLGHQYPYQRVDDIDIPSGGNPVTDDMLPDTEVTVVQESQAMRTSLIERTATNLQECSTSCGKKLRVDRNKGVIKNVKVLGRESGNGRRYSDAALREACDKINGMRSNVDHGEEGKRRSYRDRIGKHRDARLQEDGVYTDFYFNPHHALAEQLIWDAENAPENVGFSIDARGRTRQNGSLTIVEGIEHVRSVDLVADPATTRGLYESLSQEWDDEVWQESEEESHDRTLCQAGLDLIQEALRSKQPKAHILSILADWQEELSDITESAGTTVLQEHHMELKDLTLEQLRESRQDLLESFVPKTELVAVQEALDTANKELAAFRAQKADAELTEAIRGDLTKAGLNPDDESQVSKTFFRTLKESTDPAVRAELIADRAGLVKAVTETKKPVKGLPVSATRVLESVKPDSKVSARNWS